MFVRRPSRSFLYATLFTAALILLLAASVSDRLGLMSVVVVLVIAGASTAFYVMFPERRVVAVGLANGLAIYTCLFAFILQSHHLPIALWARLVGFLLPIVTFMVGVGLQRARIRDELNDRAGSRIRHLGQVLGWCLPVASGVITVFFVPDAILPASPTLVFVSGMVIVAALSALLSRDLAVFLLDSSVVFQKFFGRIGAMLTAAFAFLTFYSLLVIVFGSVYRLLSHYATDAQFAVFGEGRELSFAEALYFSLVTLATVGYGDIVPLSQPARVLVAIQSLTGIVLLLFGFSEIQHAMQSDRQVSHKDRE